MLSFDDITRDGRLWSVRYEGESENALFRNFLLDENIVDRDSFEEYQNSL